MTERQVRHAAWSALVLLEDDVRTLREQMSDAAFELAARRASELAEQLFDISQQLAAQAEKAIAQRKSA